MEISQEQIVAIAVAAIAEETQEDIHNIKVVSFREVRKSNLEQYIDDYHITYKKYRLGE